jgi:HD-GYP domain-containing protein (c-di-GMP phosphodiesterase class II)
LSEVLSALSYALDLTEGQAPGHTIRTCVIGMRIAEEIGLDADDRSALYYALLLKDAGCSSNAARMAALFGSDDHFVKPRMKAVDWHRRVRLAAATALAVGQGRGLRDRIRHFMTIARTENVTKGLMQVRCERGASIAQRLGFPSATVEAIRSLDEHWCGLGYAEGLVADEIPMLARIANISQAVEAFHSSHGMSDALNVVKRRRGTWFDPRLADVVLKWRRDADWWRSIHRGAVNETVLSLEPADRTMMADADRLDEVALAFAEIIDAKSPYTFNHSLRVAQGARFIAGAMGLSGEEQRRIYRAGLLHDIGKLGVSNRILDKAGPLEVAEWNAVERHPRHSLEILSRVTAFGPIAWTGAVHHERLDGSGYPWRLKADQLDEPMRILAVSDVYDAIISDRPYRVGVSRSEAMRRLGVEADKTLSAAAIEAIASWQPAVDQPPPSSVTD